MWIEKNRSKIIAVVVLDIAVCIIVATLFLNLSPFKDVAHSAKLVLLCKGEHPSQDKYDSNYKELLMLEQKAFQTRQQAFAVAERFSGLRKRIKETPKDQKLIAEANEAAMALHSLSATVLEMQRRAQISRAVLESQGIHVKTKNVASTDKNKWCASLRR